MSRVHGGFVIFITFICPLSDERLITPVWDLLRELRLATRDGLQGKARQLRPFLRGGFFSCLVHGGWESDAALAHQSLLHLGIFSRCDDATVILLLHPDGWWPGRLEDLPVARAGLGHPLWWLLLCGGCVWKRWPCVTSSAGPANICFMTYL